MKTVSKQTSLGHNKLVGEFLEHYEENSVIREGKPLTYAQMQGLGLLRPFAVRLPVTMIAEFDALAHYGPWASKQEMIYELIRASTEEIMMKNDFVREQMVLAAQKAVEVAAAPSSVGKRDAKKIAGKAKR